MIVAGTGHRPRCPYSYIAHKCCKMCGEFSVYLYDTAYEMIEKSIVSRTVKESIDFYSSYMDTEYYRSSIPKIRRDYYQQPSISHLTNMRLFGIATKPCVSLTKEGQSYRLFAHNVLHEIGHLVFGVDENIANSYADSKLKILGIF